MRMWLFFLLTQIGVSVVLVHRRIGMILEKEDVVFFGKDLSVLNEVHIIVR